MAIIEQLNIYYKRIPANCAQICLLWKNSKGGNSVWVFTHQIKLEPNVDRGEVFRRPLTDYSVGTNLYASITHSIGKKVIVKGDSLELQEAEALEFLAASPKVWEVFKNSDGTFKKIEVEVKNVESSIDPESALTDVTVTFERPNKPFL